MTNRKRIALLGWEESLKPLENEGFAVFQTITLAYRLFYEGKNKISLSLKEFKERLNHYRNEVLQFNPVYFLADQGFFCNLLGRLEIIKRGEMVALWIDFIKDLNKRGMITIISCISDPWPFIKGRNDIRAITFAFQIVKTHSLQFASLYTKRGQKVIYFPDYVNISFVKSLNDERDSLLEDKISRSVFNFDLFFSGLMDYERRMFYWRLSRKFQNMDYFFGERSLFYSSRKEIDFDPLNRYHLQEIYKRAYINIVYGMTNEFFFARTWGVTNRLLNIGYCQGFFLCDWRRHLPDVFDIDPELYSFKTFKECYKKIKFYLENRSLRDELADKFYQQIKERHTLDKAIKQFIYEIGKVK